MGSAIAMSFSPLMLIALAVLFTYQSPSLLAIRSWGWASVLAIAMDSVSEQSVQCIRCEKSK